jgi:Subtilase family
LTNVSLCVSFDMSAKGLPGRMIMFTKEFRKTGLVAWGAWTMACSALAWPTAYPLDPSTNVVYWLGPTNGSSSSSALYGYPDMAGLSALRSLAPYLNGAGVTVGQAEAIINATNYEVNPTVVGQPATLFSYHYNAGLGTQGTNVFPNFLGGESSHADEVGDDFYGPLFGVATNVAHVDNFEAITYVFNCVWDNVPFADAVVNQSFTFNTYSIWVDQAYDNYAADNNVLFVSGAGLTKQPVASPATCYNGIAVGVYNNAASPWGPTPDGRCKPDLTSWGNQDTVTSYSTPVVSGVATLLVQAANHGDGGTNIAAAADIRILKALLLNGAVKPIDWTNAPGSPLHLVYGAGAVNAVNSYEQLVGGQHRPGSSEILPLGGAHPSAYVANVTPLSGAAVTNNLLRGWDLNTVQVTNYVTDAAKDYYFQVTGPGTASSFTGTATLVWNRQAGQSGINNLGLYLYDAISGRLINCSTSMVDNVQHIYIPSLRPGWYDLQVTMSGNTPISLYDTNGVAYEPETYGLAYEFFATDPQYSVVGTNLLVSWPAYPSGFALQASTNIVSALWQNISSLSNPPPVLNGFYQLSLPAVNPSDISYVTYTNVGSGTVGPGGLGGLPPGVTNITTVQVYDNTRDLHFFRLVRPNL